MLLNAVSVQFVSLMIKRIHPSVFHGCLSNVGLQWGRDFRDSVTL